MSVGPPAFRPFIVPLALVLVALSGIGPIIAWRRVTRGQPAPQLRAPGAGRAGHAAWCCCSSAGSTRAPFALIMFALGAFVLATRRSRSSWRGVGARRAMTRESPPSRWRGWSGATAVATAATSSTPGVAVLLIGVAGVVLVPALARRRAAPGQSASVDGYKICYVRPTARRDRPEAVVRARCSTSRRAATT